LSWASAAKAATASVFSIFQRILNYYFEVKQLLDNEKMMAAVALIDIFGMSAKRSQKAAEAIFPG
jgi:hypothetical protein